MKISTHLRLGMLRKTDELGIYHWFAWYPVKVGDRRMWWKWIKVKSDQRVETERELKKLGFEDLEPFFRRYIEVDKPPIKYRWPISIWTRRDLYSRYYMRSTPGDPRYLLED